MSSAKQSFLCVGYCLLSLSLLQPAGATLKEVVVIGAGIGGSSCAYYLSKLQPNISLTVLDSNSYVGGRIRHTQFLGKTVELGADSWATSNRYMVQLARAMNITLNKQSSKAQQDWEALLHGGAGNGCGCRRGNGCAGPLADGDSINVWDGRNLTNPVGLAEKDPGSTATILFQLSKFLLKLEANYLERDALGESFSSISGFIEYGGLSAYTEVTSDEFYSDHLVAEEMKWYALGPLLKDIYGQDTKTANAFASMVSLTSATEPESSVEEGNSKLPEAVLKASGAKVRLNSTVSSVARAGSKFVVDYRSAGSSYMVDADAVVVAAPLEHTGIKFANLTFEREEPRRDWVWVYVTYVAAQGVDPRYFGRSPSWREPEVILTTDKLQRVPFTSLQHYDDAGGGLRIYRLFSSASLTGLLPDLFQGVAQHQEHYWPYTFPLLVPVLEEKGYQSVELALHLYNINTMESVVSAMEGSVISARNIAMLIDQSQT